MPTAALVKQVLSLATFVILLVSLVAAGTSLGLLQANIHIQNQFGQTCLFFINYSQGISLIQSDEVTVDFSLNVPTCKLSIASAAIATICLALLTAIELISVLFQIKVKTLIANIIQVGFFAGSILFLFITTVVVSAGWGKTCATFKNITQTHKQQNDFECNKQVQFDFPYPPNGADFIAAAVCAGVGILFTIVALVLFIVKQIKSKDDYKLLNVQNE